MWFNKGYEQLKKMQKSDGHWSSQCGSAVDTAFAILFLRRSMGTTISSKGNGTLAPVILPSDLTNTNFFNGRLVVKKTEKELGEIMAILNDPSHPDYEALMAEAPSIDVSNITKNETDKLRRLVRTGEPGQRRLAAKALTKLRSLDDVPHLVYALTDPDRMVVLEARNGLRAISRKFDGFGLKDGYNKQQQYDAVSKWKDWYLKIRPGVRFDF